MLRIYLSLKKPAKPSPVFFLQFLFHPIFAGDGAPAVRASAVALHLIVQVVRGCPVVGQLFTGSNVPHGNKNDLALNGNVRITGMVRIQHTAFALFFAHRRDEKLIGDLDFS